MSCRWCIDTNITHAWANTPCCWLMVLLLLLFKSCYWCCVQAVITSLVEMTESNSTLLVPVLEAISNMTAQDTAQVLYWLTSCRNQCVWQVAFASCLRQIGLSCRRMHVKEVTCIWRHVHACCDCLRKAVAISIHAAVFTLPSQLLLLV